MKQKLVTKYPLILILFATIALYTPVGPWSDVKAAPPDPPVTIRTKIQPYQVPGIKPADADNRLFKEAPPPVEEEVGSSAALAQQTLLATADATVMQGYASQNFGDTTDMWAGYDDLLNPDGKIVRSLVKFNLASLPANQVITKATLRVRLVNSWDFPNTNRTVTAYRITSSWSENSVNWNSKPGYSEAHDSKSIGEDDFVWHTFDVTDLVSDWYDGTHTNHGIMLRGPEVSGANSSWRGFSTRESSYRPQLVIEHTSGSLNPPSNLTAIPLSQKLISLSWKDNSDNETSFKIEQSLNGVSGWIQVATSPENITGRTITNLDCGTTYHFRVRASNANSNSAYSNSDDATTMACPEEPAAPVLTVVQNSASQVDLSWIDSNTDKLGFIIERLGPGATWSQIATVAANITTYSDTNLECGTTFQYRIQVITVAGTINSNEVSITTAQCTFNLFLPIIFKPAISTGDPGANRDPMFPASVELTTETQFSYDSNGRLVGAVTTITISPATDPDGDSLTYSWTASNGTITGAGLTSTWTRVVQSGGVVPGKATVEARDGKGGSDTLTINFN